MSIRYDEKNRTWTIHTRHSAYQMKADRVGTLLHTYYGPETDDEDLSYAIFRMGGTMSGNPYEIGLEDRDYTWDTLPQEISTFGAGDFRITALKVREGHGANVLSLKYDSYRIEAGKYGIPGLPASYDPDGTAETLVMTLKDREAGVTAELLYGVFEQYDVITRALRIINEGDAAVTVEQAGVVDLDLPVGEYDLVTFRGKWAREREVDRRRIVHGVQGVQSVRGSSSAAYNPSAIICSPDANETAGEAWGLAFVYSGEFLLEAEKDALGQNRVVLGIHPDDFSWTLQPGETFHTPEAALTYSDRGFSKLSHAFHDFVRSCIVRGFWKDKRRPVLLNNWEGTYFDFTGEKLISMAKDAKEMGIELFVLDDGWFGKRDDDRSGLGDWVPNEKKLGMTIGELGSRIRALGLLFGIWFEPEAISEDSDLYRAHPDWAVTVPGRKPQLSRYELILDVSREDVQDYLIEQISAVLSESKASYLKWDFNRNISDKYSHALPADRQGEFAHRFVLGTYRILGALEERFPELLIEGCSGGGARFDMGMLCYTPQIWTSDDTDPIERLTIQYGTSMIYPVNTMGAHVSAVPNHQTGRVTPLATRKTAAMSGSFGYELDPNKLTQKEKEQIREDIAVFQDLYETIEHGNYYRLTDISGRFIAWEEVRKDFRRALVNVVYARSEANAMAAYVRLRGLDENLTYRIRLIPGHGEERLSAQEQEVFGGTKIISGAALMNRGLYLPKQYEDYQAWQILIEA